MNAVDWAGITVAVSTIIGSFVAAVKWLVTHYLSELKPDGNGGHNLEGRLKRVETQIDKIYELLIAKN